MQTFYCVRADNHTAVTHSQLFAWRQPTSPSCLFTTSGYPLRLIDQNRVFPSFQKFEMSSAGSVIRVEKIKLFFHGTAEFRVSRPKREYGIHEVLVSRWDVVTFIPGLNAQARREALLKMDEIINSRVHTTIHPPAVQKDAKTNKPIKMINLRDAAVLIFLSANARDSSFLTRAILYMIDILAAFAHTLPVDADRSQLKLDMQSLEQVFHAACELMLHIFDGVAENLPIQKKPPHFQLLQCPHCKKHDKGFNLIQCSGFPDFSRKPCKQV